MMAEGLDDPCGGIQTGMQSDRRGYKMCCKQHHYVVGGITLDKIAPGKMQREFTTRWVKKKIILERWRRPVATLTCPESRRVPTEWNAGLKSTLF